ncbi:MAG: hypothetical protein JO222_00880 [Frankiales bacterium]|nr:hypothetical protein [Frankiales bacterium]
MTQPAEGQEPPQGQQEPAELKKPWGDDKNFDPDKAWKLIEGLKADKEKLAARPVLDEESKQKLAKYDEIVKANQTDLEKAQGEASRWQTEAEKWRGSAVASTVRALAATDFADPDDAVRNVEPGKYIDAGGVIDEQAIKADLAALLAAKPHYRRATEAAGPRAPKPNPAQGGTTGNPNDPAQLFAASLQQAMTGQ